jgi:lactoylglutathione lyase
MNRIVHLALKVEDLEKTTDFYQNVFGFWEAETRKTRDHLSRHLTDGNIDFTLIKYDEGADSKEATAAGEGPCIHHFRSRSTTSKSTRPKCASTAARSSAIPG